MQPIFRMSAAVFALRLRILVLISMVAYVCVIKRAKMCLRIYLRKYEDGGFQARAGGASGSGRSALSGLLITASIRPYACASLALMKKSRSVSCACTAEETEDLRQRSRRERQRYGNGRKMCRAVQSGTGINTCRAAALSCLFLFQQTPVIV